MPANLPPARAAVVMPYYRIMWFLAGGVIAFAALLLLTGLGNSFAHF